MVSFLDNQTAAARAINDQQLTAAQLSNELALIERGGQVVIRTLGHA
jgi:hypothetical protein